MRRGQSYTFAHRIRMTKKRSAVGEYQNFFKQGFISLEEVDAEEATQILSSLPVKNLSKPLKKSKKQPHPEIDSSSLPLVSPLTEVKLSGWGEFEELLPNHLKSSLSSTGFLSPTEIQKEVLMAFLKNGARNIFGSAPTGSGKTLAFLLPILIDIISQEMQNDLTALIIAPTRELALQIKDHLYKISKNIPRIKAVTLVGGLSQEKQERLLGYSPNIIIGTPGRLLEMFTSNPTLRDQLEKLKFLVLDEADRLLEKGHFKDLDDILELVVTDNPSRRTFLFSATLENAGISMLKKKLHIDKQKNLVTINVSPHKEANPSTLKHFKLTSLPEDKNLFLFSLLSNEVKGRVLVFVNSIELVRELSSLLQTLGLPSGALHAQLKQKQRLKGLERFKKSANYILVTSDVAARGLDINEVDFVIHYHVPKSSDIYVHRSGRTARAGKDGCSISLVSPNESSLFNKISSYCRLSLHDYSFNLEEAQKWRPALSIAQKIIKLEGNVGKEKRQKSWEEKAAEALGADIEERPKSKKSILDDDGEGQRFEKHKKTSIISLRAQLKDLLLNR